MKNLILIFIAVTLLSSCKTILTSTTSAKTFAVDCGDPRWDDCKDIYQQWYSVTVCGDTLATYRVYYHDCFERQGSCLDPHLVRTSKKKLRTWADINQVRHD